MNKHLQKFQARWKMYPVGYRVLVGRDFRVLELYRAWLPKNSFHSIRDTSGDWYVVKDKTSRPPTMEGCRMATRKTGNRGEQQ